MDPFPNLKDINTRPQRHWNADGLPELLTGALWCVWGILFSLPHMFADRGWTSWFRASTFAALTLGGFAVSWLTKRAKQRYTTPRAGYVKTIQPRFAPWIGALVIGIVLSLIVVGLANIRPEHGDLAAPGAALLIAAGFLIPAARLHMFHFYWLSGAAVALAIGVASARLDMQSGMIAVFVGVGLASVIVGAFRFRSFLRDNAPHSVAE